MTLLEADRVTESVARFDLRGLYNPFWSIPSGPAWRPGMRIPHALGALGRADIRQT